MLVCGIVRRYLMVACVAGGIVCEGKVLAAEPSAYAERKYQTASPPA